MKIVLFTPVALASAIGRVSKLIVSELVRQHHEVVVVRAEALDLLEKQPHAFPCRIIDWNEFDKVRKTTNSADLVVYQVGDNLNFHWGCLHWLEALPGVVCLHDCFLGHLFWGWAVKIGRADAHSIIEINYGTQVSHRFFDHGDSASFISYASASAPMTEWIASMASAVVVHSSWAIERILNSCPGPVAIIPLPYDAPFAHASFAEKRSLSQGRLTGLTIGYVNPNKRYAQVIEAVGSSSVLRDGFCYRIVGQIEPQMAVELQVLADKRGVAIVITGAVDDERLASEIQSADVMCCLRWPALEAASASTIEAMLYAKPTVVTDTGFYRDLPVECVLKVSPDMEVADLQRHLESLIADPARRDAMGQAAQKYALETFRADVYAERLVQMKREIDQAVIICNVARGFAQQLKKWGAEPNSCTTEVIASPLSIIQ